MLLPTITQNKIKAEFLRQFETRYSFMDENAPQGNNRYGTNFIIKDSSGGKYLLKVLLLEKIPQANKAQIQAEIEICKRVDSPYVVRLIDHVKTIKYVFLIFPLIEGKNLEQYLIEQGRVSEAKAKEIGIGILRGIADINRKSNGNIIHQDLKPENIFIRPNDEIVLLDFGAARYKQSPFRGNARHNFAYSSREQIRASRPNCLEELRITLSDKADVFGAGLILYRLLEGKHPHENLIGMLPADAILEARPIPPMTRGDVSVGMKKIIGRMLEYEPLNRLNALDALAAIENGDIQQPVLDKSGLFYCATSSTGRFISFKNRSANLFDGLVLEATQIPNERKQIAELHTNIKTLIIDPQTYVFQRPDILGKTAKEKFKSFAYYVSHVLFENPSVLIDKIIAKDQTVKAFIKNVFELQLKNGADVLIAPYFYIPEFNDDYWTIDQEITKLAAEIYATLNTSRPLVKGIAIAEEILQSEDSRNSIIEYLQSLYDYSGFYVLLDSSHGETITNESWLKSAKDFFTFLLATQKFVIWSRAELFGLALAPFGLNITIGEFQKQKKFNINEPRQQWGRRSKFFYLPKMFARIKWPEGLRALISYSRHHEFVCSNICCSGVDFNALTARDEENLAFHTMTVIREQFDKYIGRDGNRSLAGDLREAKSYYRDIRGNTNILVRGALKTDIKPNSSTFLTSWTNALGIR